VFECLLSKFKALSSNPGTVKKKKKEEEVNAGIKLKPQGVGHGGAYL
jgi:hypothetical protein